MSSASSDNRSHSSQSDPASSFSTRYCSPAEANWVGPSNRSGWENMASSAAMRVSRSDSETFISSICVANLRASLLRDRRWTSSASSGRRERLLAGSRPRAASVVPLAAGTALPLPGLSLLPVQVGVVVAEEHRRLSGVDLDDLVGDLPYERPVVRYEADGALVVPEGVREYLPWRRCRDGWSARP